MPGFVGKPEQIAYAQGVEDAIRQKNGEAPLHAADTPNSFFYQTGLSHQRGGFPLIPWDLVTAAVQTVDQQNWYLEGFARGVDIRNGKAPAAPTGPAGNRDYNEWLTAGTYDGQEGKYTSRYVITTEQRVAKDYGPKKGSDAIVVPPPPAAPPLVYQGPPIYEVAAYLVGKLVPLDDLLQLSKFTDSILQNPKLRLLWSLAVRIDVLGDAPGEDNEGYRLSGPNGPVAKYLALIQSQRNPPFPVDPSYYRLPAFFVTRVKRGGRRGGIRFLSRIELEHLGINPNAGFDPQY